MPFVEDIISGCNNIQAYEPGQITVNEKIYPGNLIISLTEIISPWPVTSIHELSHEHLQCIFDFNPEVVLLGTGERQIFPDIEILARFTEQGTGIEVMNTGAMCRTFNILAGEGRQVIAAVIHFPA